MSIRILPVVMAIGLMAATSGAIAQRSIPPALPGNTDYRVYSPTNPPQVTNGDDTVVCNYQRETGSLFISRVCRTLRAWKLMQADARDYMEFGFRGGSQGNEPSGTGQ
jgi:hypothetical protein